MKACGTLALVSLGCAKNAVDLQVMAGNLLKSGWTLAPDPDCADVCIVNTCSFIRSAREEAEAEIARAVELKRRGCYGQVIVTGCYPQRYPEACPEGVDQWVGVPQEWIEPKLPALRFTGRAFAYLKIAEGCAHRCAYCAIPGIRGRYRSRPMAAILREAKALLASGCRELNLVAQDPMLYGIDLPTAGGARGRGARKSRLVELLEKIDRLPGDFWVRVLYSYPSEIDEDFVVWMMTSPHAVKYLDMPIQHTDPEVLKKMNRGAAIAASREGAERLRELIPEITLRTTVMTGFPGETKTRFARMLAELKRMQFDHLGAFAYSPEEGTKGAQLKGRCSRAEAEKRERLVMEQQAKIWAVKAKRMVGRTYRALVVAPGVARMESQAPEVDGVVLLGPMRAGRTSASAVEVGEFVDLELVRVKGFDFVGRVLRTNGKL